MPIGQKKGFHHSEETKRRIAEKLRGRPMSEHTKELMRQVAKKNPHAFKPGHRTWNEGKKLTEMAKRRIGPGNPNWKGGEKIEDGYIWIYSPLHPRSRKGYAKRADLVMEGIIGRHLIKDEVVHHKNRDRMDDRPINLELCANRSEHMRIHRHEGL